MHETTLTPRPRRRGLVVIGLFLAVVMIFASGAAVGALTYAWLTPTSVTPIQASRVNAVAANTLPAQASGTLPTVSPTTSAATGTDPLVVAVSQVTPATVTVLNNDGSSGSGVFIRADGYLVTNNHVVEGGSQFEVIYADGSRVSAQVVGAAPDFDLAVLKVSGKAPAVAPLGDSGALAPGSRVAAIGSALGGFRNTVTAGVLSAHNRRLGDLDGLLQTDAAINHGNSGGPLINLSGEIIGINVAVVRGSGSDAAEGLGFSIPSNTVRVVAEQLISSGRVVRPYLGITFEPLNPQLASESGLTVVQGAYVQQVVANGPSAQAGLKVGDAIVALGGQTIDDQHPLPQVLLQYRAGQSLELTVARGDKQFTLTVRLAQRPEA
ncbi:S1C family serine protease [Candidatus Amarolinea aalborgensis]|uniref:S1C family serine protease n=1 Tax=Candidatus Amarolinea aalborgensis TaxID=2249329 RepID=UPI003BF9B958